MWPVQASMLAFECCKGGTQPRESRGPWRLHTPVNHMAGRGYFKSACVSAQRGVVDRFSRNPLHHAEPEWKMVAKRTYRVWQ